MNADLTLLKKYITPYSPKLVIIALLTIVCSVFEAVNIGALVPLLQIMSGESDAGGYLVVYLQWLLSIVGLELNFNNLLLLILVLFLSGQCLIYIKEYIQLHLRFTFVSDLKSHIFKNIVASDMTYFHLQKSGDLINGLLVETERAGSGIYAITKLMSTIFLICVYALMLFYISVEITFICIGITILGFYLLNIILRASKRYGIEIVRNNSQLNEFTVERFNLFKIIKTASTEDLESGRFSDIARRLSYVNAMYGINGKKVEIFFQAVIFLIAALILFISVSIFKLPVALLLVFLFILVRMTDPLRTLNNLRHELAGELASFNKIEQINTKAVTARSIESGDAEFTGLEKSITLDHVSFSYEPGKPVLKDVNLTIHKNEMIAIVGGSGGGKSTLVDLIIRLMDPANGRIMIDTHDIKELDLASYHAKLGVVTQDIYIFNDSVLNNICYGSDEISPGRAMEAAKIAFAHNFIMELPEGYDTPLGDKGLKLSGGQRQRISLARALYRNPELLILDEATSALDTESEKIIQDSILNIRHKYTFIIIAHRLSTIINADRIVVIEDGRIVETGKHDELLRKRDAYYRYYTMQYEKKRTLESDEP
ncbi:MAG: hypothetical protein APR53_03320 [Methanoculleus sp. SDB]|nr:MAG: hypothetical protein APR53_03320 [Methanoculleus sp. SDB]